MRNWKKRLSKPIGMPILKGLVILWLKREMPYYVFMWKAIKEEKEKNIAFGDVQFDTANRPNTNTLNKKEKIWRSDLVKNLWKHSKNATTLFGRVVNSHSCFWWNVEIIIL